MKIRILDIVLYAFFVLALIVSCQKKKTYGSMAVIKDCTGVYLRFENKDYPICNSNFVSHFSNGTVVKASFVKVGRDSKCEADKEIHCMMIHPFELGDSKIRITSIRLL